MFKFEMELQGGIDAVVSGDIALLAGVIRKATGVNIALPTLRIRLSYELERSGGDPERAVRYLLSHPKRRAA